MPRRPTTRRPVTTDEPEETTSPIDEISQKITSIEESVDHQFEEIKNELDLLKTNSDKIRQTECHHDENFFKLCHAVDYLLERLSRDYDTIACREMIFALLGQSTVRPFSGRTIRNRILRKRIKRWCLFVAFIIFIVVCMSFYGLHRNWSYLVIIIYTLGSIISWIGVSRIYKIIEDVW